jgi:predicted TIM-barrel fold metal-dependent hydrolase
MIVDCHCHIFTKRIAENIQNRSAMVEALKLNVLDALPRLGARALQHTAEAHGIDVCLLLPTAAAAKVQAENDRFIRFSSEFPRLRTLATLHPFMQGLSHEIERMFDAGITGFKFSTFSQRFDLLSLETASMLNEVKRLAYGRGITPALVFDTFTAADAYFEADSKHITTPAKLAEVVRRHPEINFIAAHMGGLLADFDELRRTVVPAPNLYLDTSNAAHTLKDDQFVELLATHGPSHILFGTDWPWFFPETELPKIGSLLTKAGYSERDQAAVFGGNAQALFRL